MMPSDNAAMSWIFFTEFAVFDLGNSLDGLLLLTKYAAVLHHQDYAQTTMR